MFNLKIKKEMKKTLFTVAAVALAMVSCNKEEINNEQTPSQVTRTMEFTAVGEEESSDIDSKASIGSTTDNTHSIHWEADDVIYVNGIKFTVNELLDGGKSAKFSAKVDETFTAPYRAVYSAGTFDNIVIADKVRATTDVDCFTAAAYSETTTLSFKHITSLLKFQVPEFAEKITSVSISSSDALAATISLNDDFTHSYSNEKNTITIDGEFETGKDYYVAVLPGEKNDFVVRLNGYLSKSATSPVTITPSSIANMKVLPAPVASDWGLVGEANDWSEKTPITMYKDIDYIVVRNFTGGAFKFIKGKSWDIERGIRSHDASSPKKGTWNLCGTKDITLASGTYDVYFSPEEGVFNYVDNGTKIDNYVTSGKAIYLQLKEWKASDAYFEAWVWGSSQADAWYKFAMVGEKDNNHYIMYIPNDATSMKILRKDPKSASEAWASWNDSGDQTIPTGKNMFIENGWNTYSWGTYTK